MAENKEQQQPQQESQIQNSFDIGLFSDCPENLQPQGTYRYAMDVVKADFTISDKGSLNANLLTNEKSTVLQFDLSTICINPDVIGNIYIDNYQYILFVVGSKNVGGVPKKYSGILLFNFNDSTCIELLTSIATHSNEDDVLNFHTHYQIQGTFRIRRNGEKVIYWTDGNNPVRTLNIDQINEYTDNLGNIRVNMLTLMKRYSNIPQLSNIAVLGGGQLPVGTYSIAVRLIDDDLNTTAWITVSRQIVITNTSSNAAIQMTGGRLNSNSDISYTNSSSKIDCTVLGNTIDDDYAYVQFGLVAYNMFDTETALKIYLSAAVPILKDTANNTMDSFYSFSSINGLNSTTASELIYKPSAIERAFTMCQVNNRLVLGNVEAAQIKWEKLQKYASAIFTEVAVKKVENLHDIENKDASFHPVHNIFDVGFQWGEIYSLGIVYVLDNGITSPVYHIPGVNNNVLNSDIIPDNNRNVIKMIPEDNNNECLDFHYDDSFGNDYAGNDLNQTRVRHHRIPLRTTYGPDGAAQHNGFPLVDINIADLEEVDSPKNYYLHIKTKRTHGGFDFVNTIIPNPTVDGEDKDDQYDEFSFEVYYHINKKLSNGEWQREFMVAKGNEFFFTRDDWNNNRHLTYFLCSCGVDEYPVVDFISEPPRFIEQITAGFFGHNNGVTDTYDKKEFPRLVESLGAANFTNPKAKDYIGAIWYSSAGAVPATYYKSEEGTPMEYAVRSAYQTPIYGRRGMIRASAQTTYGFYNLESALAKYPLVPSEQDLHCPDHHAIWFSGRVNNCSRFTYMYKSNFAAGTIAEKRQAMYITPSIYGGGATNIGDDYTTDGVYQDESLSVLLTKRNLINSDHGIPLRYGAVLSHAFIGRYNKNVDGESATSKGVTNRIKREFGGDQYSDYIGDASYNRRCLTGNVTCYINGASPGYAGKRAFQDHIRLAYSHGTLYTLTDSNISTSEQLDKTYPPYDNTDLSSGAAPNWPLNSGDDLIVGLTEIVYNVSVINKFCMRSMSVREKTADNGNGNSAQFNPSNGKVLYTDFGKDTYGNSIRVTGSIESYYNIDGYGFQTQEIERIRSSNQAILNQKDSVQGYMRWSKFWFNEFVKLTDSEDSEVNMPDIKYNTYIPGFNFSNISIPPKEELDGHKVIGYYFVANKRDANNSTILDSAYMLPTSKIRSSQSSSDKLILCGLTNRKQGTATFSFNRDWVQILSLKNKFLKEMYDSTGGNLKFIPQYKLGIDYEKLKNIYTSDPNHVKNNRGITNFGSVDVNPFDDDIIIIKNLTEDCFPGTSYSKSKNKITEEDKDGFSLYTAYKEIPITKITRFQTQGMIGIKFLDNLYPLEMKDYQDYDEGKNYTLYNYSQDNNTLIAKLFNVAMPYNVEDTDSTIGNNISALMNNYLYGYLYKELSNPYFNWRDLPFFEITPFIPYEERAINPNVGINSFGGDTYVSPIKYTNSFFYNNFLKKREKKSSWMGYLTGAVKTIMGAGKIVAGIYGGGAKVIAQGANDVIQGGLSIATDAVMDSAKKNFSYDSDKTNKYAKLFRDRLWSMHINTSSIPDDLIVTISEIINSLWFDSTINTYWRSESNEERLYQYPCEYFNDGDYSKYLLNKWTELSLETEGNRSFIGAAKNELYIYNRDLFLNSLRLHYAIPFTYDDNAKQNEKHPYRLIYSEVSFTEERNDNFRIFLPNNYKDIEGMNGEIRNIFAHNTQLIVFTPRSALVFKPSYEEKIIGSIVSYVGTGSMLSIDPQNVINTSNGIFGGMTGRFGWILLNDTIYYIDEEGRSINMFSLSDRGSEIKSMSMAMIDKFCKDNIQLKQVFDYFRLHSVEFPHKDIPYGKNGVGYLVGYDNQNNRILFTKKDKDIQGITNEYVLIDGIYYETSGPAFDAIIEAHPNWDNYYIDYSTGEIVFNKTEETGIITESGDRPNKPNENIVSLYSVTITLIGIIGFNLFDIELEGMEPITTTTTTMIFTDVPFGSVISITPNPIVNCVISNLPNNGRIITDTGITITGSIVLHKSIRVKLEFRDETSIDNVTGFDNYSISDSDDIYKAFEDSATLNLGYLISGIEFFVNNQIITFPYVATQSLTIVVQNENAIPEYSIDVIDVNEELSSPIPGLYDEGQTIDLTFSTVGSAVISTAFGLNTLHTINSNFILDSDTLVYTSSKDQSITIISTNNDVVAYMTFEYNNKYYNISYINSLHVLQIPKGIDVVVHIEKGSYTNFSFDNGTWIYNQGEYVLSGIITEGITITLS